MKVSPYILKVCGLMAGSGILVLIIVGGGTLPKDGWDARLALGEHMTGALKT